MLIFRKFFKIHSDPNIISRKKTHQTAPHFPKFLGGTSIMNKDMK